MKIEDDIRQWWNGLPKWARIHILRQASDREIAWQTSGEVLYDELTPDARKEVLLAYAERTGD